MPCNHCVGTQQYYLVAKRDFDRLGNMPLRRSEDDYWILAALKA